MSLITTLVLSASVSCSISVAEQLRTDLLKTEFTVSGIKNSVCTAEQLETEYLMWLYAQQEKQQEQQRNKRKEK